MYFSLISCFKYTNYPNTMFGWIQYCTWIVLRGGDMPELEQLDFFFEMKLIVVFQSFAFDFNTSSLN